MLYTLLGRVFIKIMKLTFGKHKDRELEEVAAEYPDYIFWMSKNNVMEISEHIMELASESWFKRNFTRTIKFETNVSDIETKNRQTL